MEKIYCNKCGREIEKDQGYSVLSRGVVIKNGKLRLSGGVPKIICDDCREKFIGGK